MKFRLSIFLLVYSNLLFSQQFFTTKHYRQYSQTAIQKIEEINNSSYTFCTKPIEVDISRLIIQQNITIDLEDSIYELQPVEYRIRGIKNFSASYASIDKNVFMTISINDNDIIGTLFFADNTYMIKTIADEEYLLIDIDQSSFPTEKDIESQLMTSYTDDNSTITRTSISTQGITTIDILVLYTTDVAEAYPNIENIIYEAEAVSNLAFYNSDINCQFNIVYIGKTNYIEPKPYNKDNFSLNLKRFASVNDGFMDEVHRLRDTYAADVCVLMCYNEAYAGEAHTIKCDSQSAFCVVHPNSASSNISFAHEIGHLIGCRHDTYMDASTTPYSYGHGYININKKWRTIMAYNNHCKDVGCYCKRLPYWSNPYILYNGDVMGNIDMCNNAQVWRNRSPAVSSFRNYRDNLQIDSLDLTNAKYGHLFGAQTICNSSVNVTTITAENNIIFQAGNSIQLNPGFHIQNGAKFHAYISSSPYSDTASYSYQKRKNMAKSKSVCFRETQEMQVYPNPISECSILYINLKNDINNIEINIVDLMGNTIETITSNDFLRAGEYHFPIDYSSLPHGAMFVTLMANHHIVSITKIIHL